MSSPLRRLERPKPDWPSIPGYRLEAVIGRGSTGTVYRALQLAVERPVAVKVLHPELVAKPRVVERLRREARMLARLHHPHLISAIDMGEVGGRWWFAMEYVDGPSLADHLRSEGPLTEREALRLFLPLAEALGALWEGGVVHRDIKPGNVLLERGPRGGVVRARLADLGLAFGGDEPGLTGQGGTLGTPHYISPEQARDPSGVDTRTDIWSFGATLFHAVCGRPPFSGESMAEVLSAVLHGRIPDPQRLAPHLGRGMSLVMRRCLVRDPARRYQDPPQLVADLELLRERRAPSVPTASLDPLEGQGWSRRRRLAVIGTAAALLGALGWTVYGPSTQAPSSTALASPASGTGLLERLVDQVDRRPGRLGGAWAELEGLRSSVPDDLVWLDVRAQLLDRLDVQLGDLLSARTRAVREALDGNDFDAARAALLDEGLAGPVREATGFELGDLPGEARRRLDVWRVELDQEVEATLRRNVDVFRDAVARYRDQLLLPELGRHVERGRWRSAMALTRLSASELTERAGLDPARLPGEEVEAATVQTRVRLDLEQVALERAWRQQERELLGWITAEVDAAVSQARLMPLGADTQVDLARRFELELELRGLLPNEFPEGAVEVFDARLAAAGAELSRLLDLAVGRRAAEAYELRADWLAPALWARREYAAAVEMWGGFAGELAQAGRVPLEIVAAVESERDAAARLLAVKRRAADRIRSERGNERELRVGNIRVAGRIDSGPDPMLDGFLLRPSNGEPYSLDLDRLALADLESLAGLDRPPAELAPDDRLALALLASAEGNRARAQAVAGSGVLPATPAAERLLERVAVGAVGAPDGASLLARLELSESEGEQVPRLVSTDPHGAALAIEVLLAAHSDLPDVAAKGNLLRRELGRLRRGLGSVDDGLGELVSAYPEGEVRMLGAARARVSLGAGVRDSKQPLELPLARPFDAAAGPWSIEFEFLPGPPLRSLDLAFAGYRVAWRPGPDGGWWGGTAGETPFVPASSASRSEEAPIAPDRARALRVEWDRTRASLAVFVDGRRTLWVERAPTADSVRASLVLRSDVPTAYSRIDLEGPLD